MIFTEYKGEKFIFENGKWLTSERLQVPIGIINELDKKRKEELTFKKIIEERKIKYLVHFTRIENLDSIFENGIIPRQIIETNQMNYFFNDDSRNDRLQNCSCFSIEYPNMRLLNRFANKYETDNWAIIVLDYLMLNNTRSYFCYHNAASYEIRTEIQSYTKPINFENMFKKNINVNRLDKEPLYFDRENIKGFDFLTTSDQAEILVENKIDPKYIVEVKFKTENTLFEFKEISRCNLKFWEKLFNVDSSIFSIDRVSYFKSQSKR